MHFGMFAASTVNSENVTKALNFRDFADTKFCENNTHARIKRGDGGFVTPPPEKSQKYRVPWRYFFCGSFMFLFCLVFAMSLCASVYMCFVVTCWETADLLALVCGVLLRVCHFPFGILGQVWYLIVSITDLCTLTYFS